MNLVAFLFPILIFSARQFGAQAIVHWCDGRPPYKNSGIPFRPTWVVRTYNVPCFVGVLLSLVYAPRRALFLTLGCHWIRADSKEAPFLILADGA